MAKQLTLENKVSKKIGLKKENVFLRKDFANLGGYDQVGRALRKLQAKGKILKIGYGLYAKAKPSLFSGKLLPVATLPSLGKEALDRLNVKTVPTQAELEYNAGLSTQVPTGRVIGIKGRFKRKIGYNGAYLKYEYTA